KRERGYAGFSELKYAVIEEPKQTQTFENFYDATVHVDAFLKILNQETYYEMLRPAIQMIVQARHVAFSGIGTSGILGSYGSRY
ncbi:MurR/RpiR family transcriptional regulator, partial [Enterococcus faecalis]